MLMDVTGAARRGVAPIRVRGMHLCAYTGVYVYGGRADLHPREIRQDRGQSRYNWTSGAVEMRPRGQGTD